MRIVSVARCGHAWLLRRRLSRTASQPHNAAESPRASLIVGGIAEMAASDDVHAVKFIDIGANLLDGMYQGHYHGSDKSYHAPDLDAVLQRAWDAGVEKVIITAGSLSEARAALDLACTHERLFCTVGVHPTRCGELEAARGGPGAYIEGLRAVLREGAAKGKVVAVGECGLDYDRLQFCDAATQRRWFAAQFALARESQLPLFLHLRAAADDFLAIVREHLDDFPAGVVHSFDGSAEELRAVLALPQLSIGINGCSLKTEENLDVAAAVPLDRLLLETDAPWCDIRGTHAGARYLAGLPAPPAKDKKKHDPTAWVKGRNEPAGMGRVLAVLAGHRRQPGAAEIAAAAYANAQRMFFPGQGG